MAMQLPDEPDERAGDAAVGSALPVPDFSFIERCGSHRILVDELARFFRAVGDVADLHELDYYDWLDRCAASWLQSGDIRARAAHVRLQDISLPDILRAAYRQLGQERSRLIQLFTDPAPFATDHDEMRRSVIQQLVDERGLRERIGPRIGQRSSLEYEEAAKADPSDVRGATSWEDGIPVGEDIDRRQDGNHSVPRDVSEAGLTVQGKPLRTKPDALSSAETRAWCRQWCDERGVDFEQLSAPIPQGRRSAATAAAVADRKATLAQLVWEVSEQGATPATIGEVVGRSKQRISELVKAGKPAAA